MPPHSKKKSQKAAKAATRKSVRKSARKSKKQKSVRKSVRKSVKKSKKTRGGGNDGNSSRKRKSGDEQQGRPSKRPRLSPGATGLSGSYWTEPGRQTVVQDVLALPIELRQEIAQYLTGDDLLKLMTMAPAPENGRAYLVEQPRTRHGAPVASLHPRAVRTPMFMPSKLEMLEKKLERKGIMEFVHTGDLKGIKMLVKNKRLAPAAFQDPDVMHWAVVHGDLDMVKYLHEVHGVLFQGITMLNASGNIDMMKYLYVKGGVTFNDRDKDQLLQNPSLELVEFMHSTGMVFPDDMLQTAVYYRDKQIFRFLHETVGLPCTLEVFEQIIARGHIDLLQYLHTKGQAFPQELLCYAIERKAGINIITFLHQTVGLQIGPEEIKTVLISAATPECIAYIVQFQPFPEDALEIVIESTDPNKQLKFIKYLMEKYKVKPTPRTMELVKQFPDIEAYIRGKLSSMALKQRGIRRP
jgi:hypothetical protein